MRNIIVAVFVFIVGATLCVGGQSFIEILIGVVLVAISGPSIYYLWAKHKSGYKRQSDADIVKQAELELQIQERSRNAKK